MYVPPHAREERLDVLQDAIAQIGFGTLATVNADTPVLTVLPMLVVADGMHGTIVGHVARANQQWRTAGERAVASFVGPSFYVSPSYYATKAETGKVVPTWNYIAVEARGRIEFYEDRTRLLRLVETLTKHHEAGRERSWSVGDAPPEYIESQLRAIVGFELVIEQIAGAWKLSRNKSEADRNGVADAIARSALPPLRELSETVRRGTSR